MFSSVMNYLLKIKKNTLFIYEGVKFVYEAFFSFEKNIFEVNIF